MIDFFILPLYYCINLVIQLWIINDLVDLRVAEIENR